MPWTDDRVATLTKMWGPETPVGTIAKRLGVTKNAVIGKAKRLGLARLKTGQKPKPRKRVLRPT